MKLLLYCTKAKKQKDLLWSNNLKRFFLDGAYNRVIDDLPTYLLNGKIVAECDFEVESINVLDCTFRTFNLTEKEILNKSCLTYKELFEYLKNRDNPRGYIIHIKNLHIFDEPKELDYYYSRPKKVNTFDWYRSKGYTYTNITLDKAPQNMMYCCTESGKDYILISIHPEWLCKILNGEKTVEVRKKVLKEMLKNE